MSFFVSFTGFGLKEQQWPVWRSYFILFELEKYVYTSVGEVRLTFELDFYDFLLII